MADTLAVKELKQIRGILGKLLAIATPRPVDTTRVYCPPHRKLTTAKNVARLCEAILYHLDAGNTCIARELVRVLAIEEGGPE